MPSRLLTNPSELTATACSLFLLLLLLSSSPSPSPHSSSSSSQSQSQSSSQWVWASPSHEGMQTFPLHVTSDSHFIDQFDVQQIENPLWRHQQAERAQVDDEDDMNVQSRDSLHSNFNLIPQTVSAAPLTGCSSVDFSAAVTLGGQGPFKLIIDTGSTTLAVASSLCTTCTGVTPLFTETAANLVGTANAVQSLYGTGTVGWTGSAYTETVSLGTPTATASVIIAGINTQMAFFQTAGCDVATAAGNTNQGIMGFAYPALAVSPTQSFFSQWQAQTTGNADVFAIQMCRKSGTLWLGGYDTAAFTGSIFWINIVRQLYYNLNIMDVSTAPAATPTTFTSLGISSTVYNAGFAIADSGTTLMLLPTTAYSQLIKTLQADTNFAAAFGANFFTSGFCYSSTQTVATLNAKLPLLRVTLGDANNANPLFLTMYAVNSYLRVVESTTTSGAVFYCPGVSALSQGTILGWAMMNQFVTVHDVKNSLIGFAPSTTCVSATTTDAFQSPAGQVSGGVANPDFPATTTSTPTTIATTAAVTKAATTKAVTTQAVTTKTATTAAASSSTTAAAVTTAAATTAAATTSTAVKKRSSLLQWVINQIWLDNNAWQVNMAAGATDVVNFTYTATTTDTSFNALAWLASSKSLPIYLSSSIPATGGKGKFNFSIPTDGSIPSGAYNLVVATTAITFTVGPAVVVTSTASNLCITSLCSFHGVCAKSACTCFAGWTGTSCQTASNTTATASSSLRLMATAASVSCVNGIVSNGACYCNTNFRGVDCSLLYLQASLTFTYSYTQVSSQLGLFGSLLATDLYQAAGLADATAISFSNITSNVTMANMMSNQAVTVTFNLQCNTSNTLCSITYLYSAYQALQTAVASTTSDYALSLSGQFNAQDLVLAVTSANAVAAVTTTTTTTTTSTASLFTIAIIIALALGGAAVLVVAIAAFALMKRKRDMTATTANVNMTRQQTRV